MIGDQTHRGIVFQAAEFIYECFDEYEQLGWKFKLNVSFLEIYNEELRNLTQKENKVLKTFQSNGNQVKSLPKTEVTGKEHLLELINLAIKNRTTMATSGNETSSRSHAIIQLTLFGKHDEKDLGTEASINLIDLAGNEQIGNSKDSNETKMINKALLFLTQVIMSIRNNQKPVYGNSNLTKFLKPSLKGKAKAVLFINISPSEDCFKETMTTLKFGSSAVGCKINRKKEEQPRSKSNSLRSDRATITSNPSSSTLAPPSLEKRARSVNNSSSSTLAPPSSRCREKSTSPSINNGPSSKSSQTSSGAHRSRAQPSNDKNK